jgi:hypothetical protein
LRLITLTAASTVALGPTTERQAMPRDELNIGYFRSTINVSGCPIWN